MATRKLDEASFKKLHKEIEKRHHSVTVDSICEKYGTTRSAYHYYRAKYLSEQTKGVA